VDVLSSDESDNAVYLWDGTNVQKIHEHPASKSLARVAGDRVVWVQQPLQMQAIHNDVYVWQGGQVNKLTADNQCAEVKIDSLVASQTAVAFPMLECDGKPTAAYIKRFDTLGAPVRISPDGIAAQHIAIDGDRVVFTGHVPESSSLSNTLYYYDGSTTTQVQVPFNDSEVVFQSPVMRGDILVVVLGHYLSAAFGYSSMARVAGQWVELNAGRDNVFATTDGSAISWLAVDVPGGGNVVALRQPDGTTTYAPSTMEPYCPDAPLYVDQGGAVWENTSWYSVSDGGAQGSEEVVLFDGKSTQKISDYRMTVCYASPSERALRVRDGVAAWVSTSSDQGYSSFDIWAARFEKCQTKDP
jgi:hypothetical protein